MRDRKNEALVRIVKKESFVVFSSNNDNTLHRLEVFKNGIVDYKKTDIAKVGETSGVINAIFLIHEWPNDFIVTVDGYGNISLFKAEDLIRLDRVNFEGGSVAILSSKSTYFLTFNRCDSEIKEWRINEESKIELLRVLRKADGRGIDDAMLVNNVKFVISYMDDEIEEFPYKPYKKTYAKGIIIRSEIISCPDCCCGKEAHNPGHHPYTEITFEIAKFLIDVDELLKTKGVVEFWAEEELTTEVLKGRSWTQFAIDRCNHFRY